MENAPTTTPTDRDAAGRFAPGNRAAAGRSKPYAKQALARRRALLEAVDEDDIREIVGRIVEAAKGGDLDAGKWLVDRVAGSSRITDAEIFDAIDAERAAEDDARTTDDRGLPLVGRWTWGRIRRAAALHDAEAQHFADLLRTAAIERDAYDLDAAEGGVE